MADAWQNSSDQRFQKFAKIFTETLKENEDLKVVIESLNANLQTCRLSLDFLRNEILGKLAADTQTVQYARLLTKIGDLETEIALQKQQERKLQEQFEGEKAWYLAEIEKEKTIRVETEQKLTNDLKLVNSIAAFQHDELEQQMQERLGSLTAQLKESNNTCNVLRAEIFSLKQRLANNNSEEKIRRLEEKLCFTEQQLKIAQGHNGGDAVLKVSDGGEINKTPALQVISSESVGLKTNVVFNQCHVSKKHAKYIQAGNSRNGFPIPPLKQLNQTKPVPKKRKLFNPDDLNYLDAKKT